MNVISIIDLKEEFEELIDSALELKISGGYKESLKGKTMGLIFEKASTRTRVSFEVAMNHLGGIALYLSPKEMQLGRGETLADTARVLSRYLDGVVIRAKRHSDVVDFAKYSSIPVINGLTDKEHPSQILADIMTVKEFKGSFNAILAYVGDGNNVCNSLLLGSAIVGLNIRVATPEGYEPDSDILSKAEEIADTTGSKILLTRNPEEAVSHADFVYTDVWVSMGQEEEMEKRLRDFKPYQINRELLSLAPHARVMHCLPAHRGQEITDEVIDSNMSIVFDQAENRLHAQKALLKRLLG